MLNTICGIVDLDGLFFWGVDIKIFKMNLFNSYIKTRIDVNYRFSMTPWKVKTHKYINRQNQSTGKL
jgi:hypothetical protein